VPERVFAQAPAAAPPQPVPEPAPPPVAAAAAPAPRPDRKRTARRRGSPQCRRRWSKTCRRPRPPRSLCNPRRSHPSTPTLAEAFADFTRPSTSYAPADGAVDITTIRPRREAPRTPPPPAPPAHPSREWVQVATGRDLAALEFDWRRIKRNAGGLLDRYKPFVTAWGQTNRLVAGPFANAREAQEFVAKLKDKQLDSFRFTSAQGQEVKPLE
jgi:hypothetical protein